MKRLIGCVAVLCLLALTVGCGGVTSNGTLAYVSNSNGTGFTVFTVNTNGTLTTSSISPVTTPVAPLVIQFSANGKWAYFLDHTGQDNAGRPTGSNIYAYTRSGNGTLPIFIGQTAVNAASSLVIAPNSNYLYVALPNVAIPGGKTGELAVYSIDQSTGILTGGQPVNVGYSIQQLVVNSSGSLLFGLAPDQQTVVSWTLNSASGTPIQSATLSVGTKPDYMILSANGQYMYVLDATGFTVIPNVASCGTLPATVCNSQPGPSPNFYAYNVGTDGTLQSFGNQGSTVFNENADLQTGAFPQNPIAGVTTNDSRYLFIVNDGGTQGSSISVFKIATSANSANVIPGVPQEVTGSLISVNGITTSTASPFPCTGCQGPSFAAVSKTNNALYVADEASGSGKIFQFTLNENSGVLRALTPASVSAESSTSQPTWITIR
jgi:6-phosphogluconolactonase (cycloisomerase 2 family)